MTVTLCYTNIQMSISKWIHPQFNLDLLQVKNICMVWLLQCCYKHYKCLDILVPETLHLQPCAVVLTLIFLLLYGDDLNSFISETKEWILPKYHRERMNQIPRSECVWSLVSVVMLYCHRPYSCHQSRVMNLPPACFCKRGDRNRNLHLLISCKVLTIITEAIWWSLGFQPPKKRGSSAIFVMREFLNWGFFFHVLLSWDIADIRMNLKCL